MTLGPESNEFHESTQERSISKTNNRKAGSTSFRKKASSKILSGNQLEIIFRDRYFCVVNKPAGVPAQTQGKDQDILSLVSTATNIAKQKMHLVNRLDQPVGGLMIIAFSGGIHAAFENLRRNNGLAKIYLAVTSDVPQSQSGSLHNYLLRDGRLNKSSVVPEKTADSRSASLKWKKLDQTVGWYGKELALLAIKLETGRHHQIRVQLAAAGWPIWGDRKYGDNQNNIKRNIALLSYLLYFIHPVSGEKLELKLKPPEIYPFEIFSQTAWQALIDFDI